MVFNQLWFWMLIAGIVAVGFGIYIFEISRGTVQGVPLWSYLLISLGVVLLVISLVSAASYYHALVGGVIYEARVDGKEVYYIPRDQVTVAPRMTHTRSSPTVTTTQVETVTSPTTRVMAGPSRVVVRPSTVATVERLPEAGVI